MKANITASAGTDLSGGVLMVAGGTKANRLLVTLCLPSLCGLVLGG